MSHISNGLFKKESCISSDVCSSDLFGKWIVLFICRQDYSIEKHCIFCFGVIILAFVSELIHDSFLNSPFDICDIVITIIAQLTIFLIPIAAKDKYFKNYG